MFSSCLHRRELTLRTATLAATLFMTVSSLVLQVKRSAASAGCSVTVGATLDDVIAATERLGFNSWEAFECWEVFFNSLGPYVSSDDFDNMTMSQSEYTGTMYWFYGSEATWNLYQEVWDGIDYFGNSTGVITLNPGFPSVPDIGELVYETACPLQEPVSYPCMRVTFSGSSLPRSWLLRQASDTEFVNLVLADEGYFTDVNVLKFNPQPSGVGDPHMVNMLGEKFELWRLGEVELLRIPQGATKSTAKLQLFANVTDAGKYSGDNCAEAPYMTTMHVRGSWFDAGDVLVKMNGGEMRVSVGGEIVKPSFKPLTISEDVKLVMPSESKVTLNVGNASIDVLRDIRPIHFFLNIKARRLDRLRLPIGGVLGMDDHAFVAQKPAHCPLSTV